MELNFITFNSGFLISHAQRAIAQGLVDTLKTEFNFPETTWNDPKSDAALLVREDYDFGEVVIKNLPLLRQ